MYHGLVKAIECYLAGENDQVISKNDLENFMEIVNKINGCKASIIQDEAGREIYRCKINFNKDEYGLDAMEVVKKLQEGTPAILQEIIKQILVLSLLIQDH